MSTLKVTNIESPSGGGVNAKITDINGGQLSSRNLIINGAMQVSQRGTVVNAGNEYGGPDRFRFAKNDGAFTISQSTDVPSGQGFSNSWKADVTSVSGTAGLNYVIFQQRFEGQNLQQLKKGSSSAESLTVQFWIKSSKAGTYIAELFDNDNTRQISKSYTVSSADTWEHKTITFPGDTSGALDNDNAFSLEVNLWLFAGSSYSSGTLSTTWTSVTDANRAVGQVNAGDNTANNIYITGVQLEVGEVATAFEHRSVGDELHRCKRYFERKSYTGAQYQVITVGAVTGTSTSTNLLGIVYHEVEKRTNPTITGSAAGTFRNNAAGKNDETATSISFNMLGVHNFQIVSGSATAKNAGAAGYISRENLESTVINIDVEL